MNGFHLLLPLVCFHLYIIFAPPATFSAINATEQGKNTSGTKKHTVFVLTNILFIFMRRQKVFSLPVFVRRLHQPL